MATIDWIVLGFPPGIWDEKKIWGIELPVITMDINELLWLIDVPFWESDDREEFALTPRVVMEGHPHSTKEWARMTRVDLSFPLDVLCYNGRWIVLDGVHRLMKAYMAGAETVTVRVFPPERLSEIMVG